ncbi:MAG TPA: Swt1 family HEPN domain-containing protein [Thermomicrobiales bacterium]
MATTNRDRVNKGMDILKEGLLPPVSSMMQGRFGPSWWDQYRLAYPGGVATTPEDLDVQALLKMMRDSWRDVFAASLGSSERNLVHELLDQRNKWAHQNAFSTDDTERVLDSIARLLRAVSAADQADAVERERQIVRRQQFEEFAKREERKATSTAVATQTTGGLRPWREIMMPHHDVQRGVFQQAEFAADLSQVARGEGSPEYRDPVEFFRRTYLTEGLRTLLKSALLRLSGAGGDPVIELQTNFGGGKTHSMLALYHLSSDVDFESLSGFEPILNEVTAAGAGKIPLPHRAVLVGTALSPGQVRRKDDGTETHTLWGELAWQLGRRKGYALIADSDKSGLNPGSDLLAELFTTFSPSLILIDEWIAFVRQLYNQDGMVAGSFDANLSFAQSLTEAVRQTPQTLLVASLPSSDIEIGGAGGREALERLRNTFGRMQTSWRPATTEEGFEIVRRRLFEPITDRDLFTSRDAVIRAFMEMYKDHGQFPRKIQEGDYRRRLETAYPIHPELFDQLYGAWSTLDKFQRTRGVLRLMASVIHTLWQRQDAGLLIMPSSLPMDAGPVIDELTRYLDDPWKPVIERDVDGDRSLPLDLDRENGNFGRLSAARRVARTVYLGSAPTYNAANRGIEDRDIKLGCAQPGEPVAVFGDALRTLSDRATHLYVDHGKYWFSTQPSVTRTAQERADGYSKDKIFETVAKRLRQQSQKGDFVRIHPCPASSADVRDEPTIGLVILDPEHPHTRGDLSSPAVTEARRILDQRGESPRLYRNTLIFAAADKAKWADLEAAVRMFLAWESIDAEKDELNLDGFQRTQAATKKRDAETAIASRLSDTYQWVLRPLQDNPSDRSFDWDEPRTQGEGDVAQRVSQRLRNDGALYTRWNGTDLRKQLDAIPLWRGDAVAVKQLVDDFARYLYLPKLKNDTVLAEAIADGLNNTAWTTETFALADSFDATTGRYLGLVHGQHRTPTLDQIVVKPDVALAQINAEIPPPPPPSPWPQGGAPGPDINSGNSSGAGTTGHGEPTPTPTPERKTRRYYAQVKLDPTKISTEAHKINQEVLQHLASLYGAQLSVTLEIEAYVDAGIPEGVRRAVDENSRTLKFAQHGFEES